MTVIAPTSNPLRRQWAAIVVNNLRSIGIDARLIYTSFGVMAGLTFACSAENCGKTYAQGGFDANFVGFGGGTPLPDFGTQNVVIYRSLTDSDYAPNGANFIFYHNDTFNNLAAQYNSEFDAAARVPIAQQMVRIVAEDRPDIPIFQPVDSYIMADYVSPQGTNNSESSATANRNYQFWKLLGGHTQLNIAETGDINSVNQWVTAASNTYYDAYLYNPTADSLEILNGSTLNYQNYLATNIVQSADHLTWTEAFRAHNFQDGAPVTADDYLFATLGSLVNEVGYVGAGTLQSLLGQFGSSGDCNCSQVRFQWLNGSSSYVADGVFSKSEPAGFTATSVWTALNSTAFQFTLSDTYLFTDPVLTGIAAAPMHIFEAIPFSLWATSPFATVHPTPYPYVWDSGRFGGNGSAVAYGPIGDGAYYYHGYDTIANTGTLVKWNGYWNRAALESQGRFNIQTIHVTWIAGKDAALAAFSNGQVNFLDSNYQFTPADFAVGAANGGKNTQRASPSAGWQDFALQNNHPVFGTGTATPKGQEDPAHAAKYARLVREAFSHAVPRQYIIDYLLQGQGEPSITEFCTCFNFAYPSDITVDSFDLTLAKSLLAQAGYTGGGGGIVITPPPSVDCGTSPGTPGGNVTVPSFIQGNTLTESGTFAILASVGTGTGGFFTTLQESTDAGATWSPVALAVATEGGYYSFSYSPVVTGDVQYRVFFTGIPVNDTLTGNLGGTGPNTPAAVEAYAPPQATSTNASLSANGNPQLNATGTKYSEVTTLHIGTLSDVITSALASLSATNAVAVHEAACNVADQTTDAIQTLNTNFNNALNDAVDSINGNIESINGRIDTVSYISYAALAVAIILGLLAISMARRKPS